MGVIRGVEGLYVATGLHSAQYRKGMKYRTNFLSILDKSKVIEIKNEIM